MSRPRRLRPCSRPGCPELVDAAQTDRRCDECRRAADRARGTAAERGYDARWRKRRAAFLSRHPFCVLCSAVSRVADHYPLSRKELLALGVADPDADERLRALCVSCHASETMQHQPGGFTQRDQ